MILYIKIFIKNAFFVTIFDLKSIIENMIFPFLMITNYDLLIFSEGHLIISNPHFLYGSLELQNFADGIKPDLNKHKNFIEIDQVSRKQVLIVLHKKTKIFSS